MKFEKIAQFMQPDEKINARLKPVVGYLFKRAMLVSVITILVILLPCIYFLFTDTPMLFYFFLGICVITFFIVVLALLTTFKKLEYIITDKNLYVPVGARLIIIPLNSITIVNEQKILDKKPKICNLIIKTSNRRIVSVGFAGALQSAPIGLANVAAQATLHYGKIALQGMENPEEVISLLRNSCASGNTAV